MVFSEPNGIDVTKLFADEDVAAAEVFVTGKWKYNVVGQSNFIKALKLLAAYHFWVSSLFTFLIYLGFLISDTNYYQRIQHWTEGVYSLHQLLISSKPIE